MGSNALNALLSKAFSERSEDFSAAQRRESIGIFVVWVGRPGGPVCRPYEPHPSRYACHLPLKGKARAADSRPYMYPEAILSLS